MALVDEVRKLAGVAERLKGPVGNEANTKALLIEPLLSALGWDTTNLDHVLRDWPVHNNSSIDYALRIGDENVMFVEVRGVNDNLDDESFTTRAVERVNDEGVLWCVTTNGLIYRVYRSDELVPTDEKLSFEVDLSKVAVGSPSDCANLPLLSRESLADGSLALWGEQKVFTDPRVRTVLAQLAAKPSAAFLDAINEAIGEHKVPRDRLRASLSRVLVVEGATTRTPGKAAPTPRGSDEDRGRDERPPPMAPPKAEAPHRDEAREKTEAPERGEAAGKADTSDKAGSPETARRRFLGGPARASRDTAAPDPNSFEVDPYAPLSTSDEPFDDGDS